MTNLGTQAQPYTNSSLFGASLKAWRKNILQIDHASHMHDRIKAVAADLRKCGQETPEYKSNPASSWELGKIACAGRLVFDVIIPSYGIDDFVLFYAMGKTALAPGGLHPKHIESLGEQVDSHKSVVRRSPSQNDYRGPFRIDHVEMMQGGNTPWGEHAGHEFAMVLRGEFEFRYGCEDNPTVVPLSRHGCIEFNSQTPHSFFCISTTDGGKPQSKSPLKPGVLVIAKTRRMDPKQL